MMRNDNFDVPILFLIYRQPEITKATFERIRQIKPSRLYIAADGPHRDRPSEKEECELTRRVIDKIDWPCKVEKRFLPENVGLKKAVSGAIEWFFSEVDEGIILEYDCLATPSFFYFCREMLNRYRNDESLFCITGDNIQHGVWRGDGDYYFSNLFGCWGWATWKRSWKYWKPNLPNYERFKSENQIANIASSKKSRKYWIEKFDDIHAGRNTTTWAFCFLYAQLCQRGLCVVPNRNLVSNIGFSKEGTHAKDPDHPLANMQSETLNSFRAPTFKIANIQADERQTIIASSVSLQTAIRINAEKILKSILPKLIISVIRKHRSS